MNEGEPNYGRVYAWFRLVKLWSGMRFDDTKGTPNRTMELAEWGCGGRSKTKTLRKVGERYRQPGVHCGNFEFLGEVPDKNLYHKACWQCFRKGDAGIPEEESSGEVSSSEMTESEDGSI